MPSPIPRWDRRRDQVAPRKPATAAFPVKRQGRLPQLVISGPAQRSLTLGPACSRGRQATLSIRGFGSFVTSTTAPIATGWSDRCRVGIAPTEDRHLSRRTVSFHPTYPQSENGPRDGMKRKNEMNPRPLPSLSRDRERAAFGRLPAASALAMWPVGTLRGTSPQRASPPVPGSRRRRRRKLAPSGARGGQRRRGTRRVPRRAPHRLHFRMNGWERRGLSRSAHARGDIARFACGFRACCRVAQSLSGLRLARSGVTRQCRVWSARRLQTRRRYSGRAPIRFMFDSTACTPQLKRVGAGALE